MEQQNKDIKPLIMLCTTPLGHYFYDTNRNEIVSVNKHLFRYIEGIMKDDEDEIQQAGKKQQGNIKN